MKNKIKNDIGLQGKYSNTHTCLLPPCSFWAICLMVNELWFVQVSPLKAMESFYNNQFYEDSDHPLTQAFWKEKDLSDRLKKIQSYVLETKERISNHELNQITFGKTNLKEILKCLSCDTELAQSLHDVPHNELLINSFKLKYINSGRSGDRVIIASRDSKNFIAIKKFENIEKGLQELLHSLVALKLNPLPEELKMARVYDAIICPKNCLSIIMEGANGYDIEHFLDKYLLPKFEKTENAVKACAKYLATFHIKSYHNINKINSESSEKYIAHVANAYHTLIHNPLKEEKKEIDLLNLSFGTMLLDINEEVSSKNIIKLLKEEKQQIQFKELTKKCCMKFEENVGKIFRLLKSNEARFYFVTLTHGDAHGNNFFYNEDKVVQGCPDIPNDSFKRITMIDFSSIRRSYGNIGDPAEDVGRFLGFLWGWAAVQTSNEKSKTIEPYFYDKVKNLQKEFIQSYLNEIKSSGIFTEKNLGKFNKIFKENYNFYKFRFYRVFFNSEKDKDIKKKILESWIKENASLESSSQTSVQQEIIREKSGRTWDHVCTDQEKIIHSVPEQSEVFIECAVEGQESYLTRLWRMLKDEGNVTLSSKAAIAGMGGVGKTSLALEYAHEALANKAYNLIYWLPCSAEHSLIKGYKDLLLKMGISYSDINGKGNEDIIDLVNTHVLTKGKCLLIYDNVPCQKDFLDFLNGKMPQNTHILMTSRFDEGGDTTLNLDVFRLEDSINYLLTITGLKDTPDNEKREGIVKIAGELGKALGHLPLALAHAAHYIKLAGGKNVSERHFKEYLEGYRIEQLAYLREHQHRFKTEPSEMGYEHLIGSTFRMAEKYLSKLGETETSKPIMELAKKLIEYAAYLDADAIPEDIFLEFFPKNKENLKKALEQLYSLSLIKRTQNEPLFSIHRLVQLVVRNAKESKENPQYKEVFSHIIPVFNTLFKTNIFTDEQIDNLLSYFPHILKLLEHLEGLKISPKEVDSLEWIGRILYIIGTDNITHSKKNTFQENNPLKYNNKNLPQILKNTKIFLKPIVYNDIPIWLQNISENSHPTLQATLGCIYYVGLSVTPNHNKAIDWCTKAAAKGNTLAQFILGDLYVDSQVVEKNYTKAFELYCKAATQGRAKAEYRCGMMYLNGLGVNKNTDEAFNAFTNAAKQKDVEAQIHLGMMCQEKGDYAEALKCFKIAIEQEDDLEARGEALTRIGQMYQKGQGVEQDNKEALKYFSEASDNYPVASFLLGMMHVGGKGVPKDDKEACTWFTRAAEQGIAKAQATLGFMFANGRGVSRDQTKAFQWYFYAADQGDPDAQYEVGLRYQSGEGTNQNHIEAFIWLNSAAQQGHVEAQAALKKSVIKPRKFKEKIGNTFVKNPQNDKEDVLQRRWLSPFKMKIEKSVTDVIQQIPEKTLTSSKFFVGKEKKEKDNSPVEKQDVNEKVDFQESLSSKCKKFEKTLIKVKQNSENNLQTESKNLYTLQGDRYISAAIKHAEEGNIDLAEHLAEEANKKYELGEDSRLAENLQKAGGTL